MNARLLLEKTDLVERVHALLGDERQERAREAAIHAREEEVIARQHAMMEEQRLREEHARQERERAYSSVHTVGNDAQKSGSNVPPMPAMEEAAAELERNGLCVVCQDEEANIAIVDCGYVLASYRAFRPRDSRSCLFADIWRCAAVARILSCLRRANAHSVVLAS